ncbi:MAG: glycosyltransferase 87 family protein [Promethearchaeota archaeon]
MNPQRKLPLLVAATCAGSIVFILLFQPLYGHDYYNHLFYFRLTLNGNKDIWGLGYPVLFNLLAVFLYLGPFGPKIAYSVVYHAWVLVYARDLWELEARNAAGASKELPPFSPIPAAPARSPTAPLPPASQAKVTRHVLFALFNPLVWSLVYYFGEYDIVVGVCIYAAVRAARRERDFSAGVWVGVATLLKFGGVLVALPLLFLKKVNTRFALGLASLVGVVAAAGFAYFGTDVVWKLLNPFLQQGLQSRVEGFTTVNESYTTVDALLLFLERSNVYIVGGFMVVGFYFSRRQRNGYLQASIIQILVFLTFFKVKNVQFLLWVVPLFSYWHATDEHGFSQSALRAWDVVLALLSCWITFGLVLFSVEWVPHLLFGQTHNWFFGEAPVFWVFFYFPIYVTLGFLSLWFFRRTPWQKELALRK